MLGQGVMLEHLRSAVRRPGLAALGACRRGAATMEMAIVAPLLSTMILGVMEMGCVVYSYSTMQLMANRVGREIAVNTLSQGAAPAAITSGLPAWLNGRVTVTITQSAPADPTQNLIRIQLATTSVSATPIALLTRLANWNMTTDVTMKQELPYVD